LKYLFCAEVCGSVFNFFYKWNAGEWAMLGWSAHVYKAKYAGKIVKKNTHEEKWESGKWEKLFNQIMCAVVR